jgi:hypothetical protein
MHSLRAWVNSLHSDAKRLSGWHDGLGGRDENPEAVNTREGEADV